MLMFQILTGYVTTLFALLLRWFRKRFL